MKVEILKKAISDGKAYEVGEIVEMDNPASLLAVGLAKAVAEVETADATPKKIVRKKATSKK